MVRARFNPAEGHSMSHPGCCTKLNDSIPPSLPSAEGTRKALYLNACAWAIEEGVVSGCTHCYIAESCYEMKPPCQQGKCSKPHLGLLSYVP